MKTLGNLSILVVSLMLALIPGVSMAAELPNLVVNNVNFYYENGGYYVNPVINNNGFRVTSTNATLAVSLRYNGENMSKSQKYDCDYYMCGYVFGPFPTASEEPFEVVADSDNGFVESSETDNTYLQKLFLADFAVSDIKTVKKWGGKYYADVTIKNIGDSVKSPMISSGVPYSLAVLLEDDMGNSYSPLQSINLPYFSKSFVTTLRFGPLDDVKKLKNLKASVDSTNILPEADELNNTLEKKFKR